MSSPLDGFATELLLNIAMTTKAALDKSEECSALRELFGLPADMPLDDIVRLVAARQQGPTEEPAPKKRTPRKKAPEEATDAGQA